MTVQLLFPGFIQNSMYSSYLAFSPSVFLESKWYNHTVALTWLHFRRIPILSDFHMVDNLLIMVHVLPMRMLTSLSVDEILLPRYMNRFTNFRDLPFNEMISSLLKHMNSILSDCVKT